MWSKPTVLTEAGRAIDTAQLTPTQANIVELLASSDAERGVSVAELRTALGGALTSVLATLRKRGLIAMQARIRQDTMPRARPVAFVRAITGLPFEVPLTAPRQQAALDFLRQRVRLGTHPSAGLPPGAITVAQFRQETGAGLAVLNRLVDRGLVEMGAVDWVREPQENGNAPAPTLTPAQQDAWKPISEAIVGATGQTFLLHGVTGSGKTEIYLRAVAASLRLGKGAIVCVPEIALATQMVNRIQARFPGQVALLHSGQKDARRASRTGSGCDAVRRPVAIGPRSALFAPIEEIGCIVLDEEHDAAYKAGSQPRYHAREVASELARTNAGRPASSAARRRISRPTQRRRRVKLAISGSLERVRPAAWNTSLGALELPPVQLVDMREERRNGNGGVFSVALVDLLLHAHGGGRASDSAPQSPRYRDLQPMPRHAVMFCICPQCDVPLVYHADRERLRCHRCDFEMRPSIRCPQCGKPEVRAYGVGTQRVEDEVRRLLPTARVTRWDQDSLRTEGGHESILRRLEAREIDVLVGTQMVAKGLDLPWSR